MLTILGYADRLSVAPGETIRFMVSAEDGADTFRCDMVRLICGDDHPEGPGFKERPVDVAANGDYAARKQVARAGSCVLVPASPRLDGIASFTVRVMVWATTPGKGRQGLVSKWDADSGRGFALVIDDGGGAALHLSGGVTVASGVPLEAREWTQVAARYDADSGAVVLEQTPLRPHPYVHRPVRVERRVAAQAADSAGTPLVMAAWHEAWDGARHVAGGHFNGKLAAPRLADRALDPEALRDADPGSEFLVGAWDFARDISSERVTDLSAGGLHGHTVNLPTRAMTGPGWTGETLLWTEAPGQYDAIHFHDDDVLDCGWEADLDFTVPEDLPSGVYAARLSTETGVERVPFFVRPPPGRATAKVAFLASTATYIVYANAHAAYSEPLDEMMRGSLIELQPADLHLNAHRELGLSIYDTHSDGSGVYYASRHRPMLNLRPMTRLWNFSIDMYIVDWLEARGIAYDVITDEDLHAEGHGLLEPYKAVVTCSHPEYSSLPMLEALEAYRDGGGRLMYLGGNGFYWRISFHPSIAGVIESRRTEGSRSWDVESGERYHGFDGAPGGLWRNQGRAPQALVGVGMNSEGFDMSSYYRRGPGSFDPGVAFIFEGVGTDEKIGDFGVCEGGAAGYETDRHDRNLGAPANTVLLASSEGLSRYYELVLEEMAFTTPAYSADENDMARADMVFFACPNGGAVFSTGSISWAGSLPHNGYDNNVSRITENVLRRFLDPAAL